MHRVTLLAAGRLKTAWIAEGVEHFQSRLAPHIRLEIIEVPAGRQADPEKYRQEESAALLERLQKMDGAVWLLDENGKEMTSAAFASTVQEAKDRGQPLIFVLGGAYGVTDAVRSHVHRSLALSKMTFPHELCRLVFLEQLYRATELGRGSGYHH